MELQFQKTTCPYLRRLTGELRSQEQSQELRLPDGMPDIGRVLGNWGQVLLRGKEWHSGSMQVSGGVMVWVLYEAEDGEALQTVEAWLPFQMKWDLPDSQHDGVIRVTDYLKSVDSRSTSARKLMIRATVELYGEAFLDDEAQIYTPEAMPADVQVLKKTYPMLLAREAGEHAFEITQELTLPPSAPKLEKLIRFSLQPRINEKKVMTDKAVFRGSANLHILYMSDDGALYCWDFDVPFSQFTELDREHDADAQVCIQPVLTSLELDTGGTEQLQLTAGLSCQYEIRENVMIEVAEDAYSTCRTVTPQLQQLSLPAILEEQNKKLTAQLNMQSEGQRDADIGFLPQFTPVSRMADAAQIEENGTFQLLYYDAEGRLQWMSPKWNEQWSMPASEGTRMTAAMQTDGLPQAVFAGDTVSMSSDLEMSVQTVATQAIPMIAALELGEEKETQAQRPSLILQRFGEDSLWQIAKACGSTVEAIEEANHLTTQPDWGQMLLIPVL